MIDYELQDLFRQDSIDKQLIIEFDGGKITNTELHAEEFSLDESLCSENELTLGCCEASSITFTVSNVFTSLIGKFLDVSVVLNHNDDKPFKIGKYKVYSDVPTADRIRREITAYDELYDIINADVASWYNTVLPKDDSTVTLKQFRDSFFAHFGVFQKDVVLPNDNIVVQKTVQPAEMSGKTVICAICEINGCFGRIGRDGLFHYIFLKEHIAGVYPADDLYPSDDLFPADENAIRFYQGDYIECRYQDYIVNKIDRLELRQEENSSGAIVGQGNNTYVIKDNFILYGKSSEEMQLIANRIFSLIYFIEYRPFEADARGNLCYEVGDLVQFRTKNEIVDSYIFQRHTKGIQRLIDSYSSSGEKNRTGQVNSIANEIVQLKGQTNTLERTAEETKSALENLETGLRNEITQTAEETKLLIEDTEKNLQSEITQTAEKVSTKVSKGEVISEINQSAEQVKIEADKIALEGTVTANGNVEITTDGRLKAVNGEFTGNVNATSLVAKEEISLYAPTIGIPGILPVVVMSIIDGMAYGTSGGALRLYDYTVIGNLLLGGFWGNEIKGYSYIDISSETGGLRMASSTTPTLRPLLDDAVNLGNGSNRYKQIYCISSQVDLSDKNAKTNIGKIPSIYEELFFKAVPSIYRFKNKDNNSNHDRIHFGLISQDFKAAMDELGISDEECAVFCRDVKSDSVIDENGKEIEVPVLDEEGNPQYIYGMRYGELIPLNMHMIQKAFKRIDELENQISEQQSEIDFLKESVSFLMEKLVCK